MHTHVLALRKASLIHSLSITQPFVHVLNIEYLLYSRHF